ncbi:MAG: TlpA family protein disulfide reductase [Bacteroidota bacterium]
MGGMEKDFEGKSNFYKNSDSYGGWDFTGKNNLGDVAFMGNDLKIIDHNSKFIYSYPEEYVEDYIKSNIVFHNSPFQYLQNTDWIFLQDTVITNLSYQEFKRNEIDTLIADEDSHIIVDNHIFVNTKTALLERYERRPYENGKKLPKIISTFTDYKLVTQKESISYQLPDGYSSILVGENRVSKNIGDIAPSFQTETLNGDIFDLEKYRGRKILFNFSFINCGNCKLALKHFNRQNYKLSEKISAFYINPVDSKEAMELYAEKDNIPYPILQALENIEELYGVSGYPTFVLIDEEGKIENIMIGYSSEFLTSLETP